MAWMCNSKSQKLSSCNNLSENSYKQCKFNLEYPPLANVDENLLVPQIPNERNSRLNSTFYPQNAMSKRKLKFQCHYEERKRRAEFRRKKIIQRLKKIYQIDVEGLNEDITKNIIMKTEIFEREKKEREKRKLERSVIMITRLLEEQKYKNRARKVYQPPWSKTIKRDERIKNREIEFESKICFSEIGEDSIFTKKKVSRQTVTNETVKLEPSESKPFLPTEEEMSIEGEKSGILPQCKEIKKIESLPKIFKEEKLKCKRKPPIEKCLESTPRQVIFKDYKKNTVYLQDLKITNISCETIHCRYLGIVVHTKTDDRFPIGVAVRDSVKLRPGLSCSTKIRLCSQDDTKQLDCSIVYETRRPKTVLQHSWFLVRVSCIPLQAIVKVTPLKIIFPTLSWCEATGLDCAKLLCRNIKIENSGGKACFCNISNKKLEDDADRETIEEDGAGEQDFIGYGFEAMKDFNSESQLNSPANMSIEYYGEFSPCEEDFQEIPKSVLDELIDGIFGPFRFSRKFCIEIPPLSTVYIQVRFIPHYKGFHHETYFLQFENCDNCNEQAIELVGDIKKVPLRVEPQVIDLKTCISNSGVYSGAFKVFNDSKGPHWVVLKLPSSVKNHAHVYPTATIVLPFSSSEFSVRIYPRVTLARDAPRYYSEDSQIFEFPIFIHPSNVGSCKRDYLKIYVLALLTDYYLQLSPSDINFGTVSTLETVRTQLELTNHSLAAQEYGFLNLPKGVRVEPNMGFGTILPKESIKLYLLYSPEDEFLDCEEEEKNDEFQVIVTSIAKYGGFREKLESYEESSKSIEFIWGEDQDLSSIKTNPLSVYQESDFDECEENSSIEGEELCWKVYHQESKIREFLRKDRDETSEVFSSTRVPSKDDRFIQKSSSVQVQEASLPGEFGEIEGPGEIFTPKKDLHIVNCHAVVIKPRCRLSDSVIQLPATPCSSFSLYRFRLTCTGEEDGDCICGFRKTAKKYDSKSKSRINFEFQYVCPHFKLEPESGIIKPGENIPITIIYRPVCQANPETEVKEQTMPEVRDGKETPTRSSSGVKESKGKKISPKMKSSGNIIENVMKTASKEMKDSDYFAQEKGPEKSISPFVVDTKVRCIVKVTPCSDSSVKTEIHEMVLICPVINPKFVYLGKCQEIKFDKVFIGTKSKVVFEIQNVSLERISPSATFLSPLGPFYCSAGIHDVEVDPEHIWRQPLIYAPLERKGVEKQFFEIYCGSTNIFLTVSGEGIHPDYKITPNFACCLIESKPGSTEELKVEVENLSTLALNISIQTNFLTRIPDSEEAGTEVEDVKMKKEKLVPKEEVKKEKTVQKDEVKDKKKPKRSGNQNFKFWEEIPEDISSSLQNLDELYVDEELKVFTLGDENKSFVIPPLGKQQIKVLFMPPPDKNDGTYAVQYGLMLEKISLLKEMLVIGKIFRGK